MPSGPRPARLLRTLAALGLAALAGGAETATAFDPLLSQSGGVCQPLAGGRPVLLQALLAAASARAKSETAPFQPATMQAEPARVSGCTKSSW